MPNPPTESEVKSVIDALYQEAESLTRHKTILHERNEALIKQIGDEIEKLKKKNLRYEMALKDFSNFGCRHDTNPTTIGNNSTQWWYSYIEGMDRYVRDTAKEVLNNAAKE